MKTTDFWHGLIQMILFSLNLLPAQAEKWPVQTLGSFNTKTNSIQTVESFVRLLKCECADWGWLYTGGKMQTTRFQERKIRVWYQPNRLYVHKFISN
jgi:hypothetical protein